MSPSAIRFDHLERLTDDTGLLEHCLGRIPRRREGYSADDNARAIWLCVEWLAQLPEDCQAERSLLYRLLDRYLAFLLWAQKEDGWFQNNIRFDRTPEPEERSEDCLGRSLWASAVVCVHLSDEARREVAAEILRRALLAASELRRMRGLAWALAAGCLLLAHTGLTPTRRAEGVRFDLLADARPDNHPLRLEALGLTREQLTSHVQEWERRLTNAYEDQADDGWRWFEPELNYSNGLLPWAMWVAWRVGGRETTRRIAEASLDFLVQQMSGEDGRIRPIGNRGWCTREWRADWDQQPIDVMKLALAAREAYLATGEARWREVLRRSLNWFHGDNDLNLPMADPSDGSCCDGLSPSGANPNRGAESTLSYLFTEAYAASLNLAGGRSHELAYTPDRAASV
ncbi:glycosyl transferase [Alicyclobacillus kakegawensis]|uniref:glycosyl transferase n=1 Tax=Alicyclobacillus kakegawensis TaxID=392012 RepID=UPI00083166EE|nr:glycosyl transferase [Alicyclobacillus kakegawensis]